MTSLMLRRILLLCFFISGATGLVYEVVWARYLTVFIGGTAMAHTIVLATFMGGLALGNAWLGKWADRVTNKLLLYAFLEFGIGLVCLIFPEFFALLGKAYISMAAGSTPGSISLTLLKTVLAILAILPPCVLMGGTLPVLTKAIVGQLSKVGTRIGLIYAINTAGALAGIFLAGFVLLEQFGLSMSIRISAAANIVLVSITVHSKPEVTTRLASEVAHRLIMRRFLAHVAVKPTATLLSCTSVRHVIESRNPSPHCLGGKNERTLKKGV